MPKNLSGSIALSKVKHVLMTCKGKSGDVKGMFIPFEANKLDVIEKPAAEGKPAETQIYMPVRVHIKDEDDQNGQIGFVSKSLNSKDYKALGTGDKAKEAAKEFTPILGSLKDFSNAADQGATEGNKGDGKAFDPSDDVPF